MWKIPSQDNDVYLTFDDGPIPDVTENILSVLNNYNVKATFFCVGENVIKHPHIFESLRNNGHALGNHTFKHLNGWKTTNKTYFESVESCNALLKSPLFRPPYGRISFSQAYKLSYSYKIIMWSLLTYDFDNNISPDKCLKISLEKTKKGSIVVFHDNVKASKNVNYALPRYLEALLEKGFNFKKLY